MKGPGAAADAEAAGKDAFLRHAASDAGLHGVPDPAEAGVDLGVGALDAFVLPHHVGDAEAGRPGRFQHLAAADEVVGDGRRFGKAFVAEHLLFGDDEAAADGVVDAGIQHGPVGVGRGEAHAVRVTREAFRPVKGEVGGLVEGDIVLAAEPDAVAGTDSGEDRWNAVGIDRVRHLAGQAQQHGLVGAVADTRQCQRAEQFGLDPGDAGQRAALFQAGDEGGGRLHRSDGVGAGWSDADLEDVEYAYRHGRPH